jgi:hypothetical protein
MRRHADERGDHSGVERIVLGQNPHVGSLERAGSPSRASSTIAQNAKRVVGGIEEPISVISASHGLWPKEKLLPRLCPGGLPSQRRQ